MSLKVLSAEINHETNTFNVRPTTIQCFKDNFFLMAIKRLRRAATRTLNWPGFSMLGGIMIGASNM